ncbi:MAG: hypothetical protein LBH20_11825 [Treponema sp.]|jgi:hypothetical protein|nr:hypothetical protein [Treponema sp.]
MANKKLLLGMLVIAFVSGMTVVRCKDEPSPPPPTFPPAKGKLTINGLDSFNDKYVYLQGVVDNSVVLLGFTNTTGSSADIAYNLVKISGGKAEVPLYTVQVSTSSKYSASYVAYSGNDTLSAMSIIILSESSLKESNASTAIMSNLGMKMFRSGTFSNGNMAVDWGTIAGTWTPNGGSPIQLTANEWVGGNIISSSGEQWFTFTATASTQYIHVGFGTLTNLNVQIYDSSGNTAGGSVNLYSSTRYTSRSVTSDQKYYIKVWPSMGSGTYQIAFNTSSAVPSGGGIWTPSGASPIQLTANEWAGGNISSSGGEQWFTFTATASTQYIHVSFDTLKDLNVQIYDSNGDTTGSSTNLYSSTRYTSRSVTSGQKYYIKVWPYTGSGTYQIAFNTSNAAPSGGGTWTPNGGSLTQLTANRWTGGNITSPSGEQWFAFTATASTQYIHVSYGTLIGLCVQLYDSNGKTAGSSASLYGSARYISRSVTSGQKYYIKVWPYLGSGTYQIAFSTSSASP